MSYNQGDTFSDTAAVAGSATGRAAGWVVVGQAGTNATTPDGTPSNLHALGWSVSSPVATVNGASLPSTVPITVTVGEYVALQLPAFLVASITIPWQAPNPNAWGTSYTLVVPLNLTTSPPPVPGCTNPAALNYNPLATVDDGSCILPVRGCTDPTAQNYNSAATSDDGSCLYTPGGGGGRSGGGDGSGNGCANVITWT